MQTWYLQMSDSASFAQVNDAVNTPEATPEHLRRVIGVHLASAPQSPWFVIWLMQTVVNVEYAGQVDKAGVMIAAIDQARDWIKNEELKANAETIIKSFEKRVNIIGKQLLLSGLVRSDTNQPFDPEVLKASLSWLIFWASWCGPCRGEFPHLRALYEKYKGRNFEIVGVNLDDSEENMQKVFEVESLPWIHVRSNDPKATGFKTPIAWNWV